MHRCVNEVNSPTEEIDQRASKALSKVNRTSVSSKSTTTELLELDAMKKQEEIDEQLASKKGEAEIRRKQKEMIMRILAEELENAKVEEKKGRAKRISEEEMEITRAGSSRASTYKFAKRLPNTHLK